MKNILLLIVCLCLGGCYAPNGKVVQIQDATTWWVDWRFAPSEQVILQGVMCFHNTFGGKPTTKEEELTLLAKQAVEKMVLNKRLLFQYNEKVVIPHLPNGVAVQEVLLNWGLVCLHTKSVPKEWIISEKVAQKAKLGMWATDPPTLPISRPYNAEDLH